MRKSPTPAGLDKAPSVEIWSDTTAGRNANIWAPEIDNRLSWETSRTPVDEGPEPFYRDGRTFRWASWSSPAATP